MHTMNTLESVVSTRALTPEGVVPGRAIKEAQTRRAEEVQTPEFLDRFVRPHLPAPTVGGGVWDTEVIQLDGSGAATVRISLDGCRPVFTKLFPGDDGPTVHQKLVAFQEVGFDPSQRYQTVEPLAWYGEERLLLCRGAAGRCLDDFYGDDGDEAWRAGVAEAGAWLGRFHSSGLAIGTPKSLIVTSELLSLAKRLAKALVATPEYLDTALDMIGKLTQLSYETRDGMLVQSHGQYRPIHVFLDTDKNGAVTVIDLDRSAPADPGRDVAEFLHRLHTDAFQRTGRPESAERATRDFLDAYATAAGSDEFLANVAFHRGRYIVHTLSRLVKKGLLDDPEFPFWREQFEQVVSGRAGR